MTTFSSGVSLGITGSLYAHGYEVFNSGSLFITTPDVDSNIDLIMNPVGDNDVTIFIEGKEIYNSGIPLFIGKEYKANNNTTLYINNDIYAPSGDYLSVKDADLFIKSVSGALSSAPTLFLESPNTYTGSGDTYVPLFLKVEEPIIGSGGGIIGSGTPTLFVQGNNNANIAYTKEQNTTLYLASYPQHSGNMTLFLDRPISEVIPLNINAFIGSGNMNVYISGNYTHNNNTTLFVKPPESNDFKIFFRGYLE